MTDRFLEYLEVEKRYSPHTVSSYRKDLLDFSSFLLETEGHSDLLRADKKMVRNFIAHLSENKIAKRSINRKISALRSFYKFLLKIQEISVSPLEGISTLKFYAEKQIPFSEEEMKRLQELFFDVFKDRKLEKLIIETLYQTGVRRAELCSLRLQDVDFSKKELLIHGKGNKQRVVPLSDNLVADYQSFVAENHPSNEAQKQLLVRENGKNVNEKFVYSVVNRYLSIVTSKKKKSPHILRHSFATSVLKNGAQISKVKKILGHSSLASTQVYTNANIEELKKVFNLAHPRANKKDEK